MRTLLRRLFAPRDKNLENKIRAIEAYAIDEIAETEKTITEFTAKHPGMDRPKGSITLLPSITTCPKKAHR